jgi:hypothetical protein
MRTLLLIGAAVLVAAPVIAQPSASSDAAYQAPLPEAMSDDEDWDAQDYDRRDYDPRDRDRQGYGRNDQGRGAPPVLDPRQVEVMAGAVDRLIGAVMDLPIGGIAAAVDPYGRGGYHPGATVRDMATRDDPYAEARMRAGIRGASRGVGAMSRALERVMPELERSLDQVGREIEAAMDEADLGQRERGEPRRGRSGR